MVCGGLGLFDDVFEDYFITLVSPKLAASLTKEQLDILRAHVRSEVIFSPEVKKILTRRANDVLKEFGKLP